MGKFGWVASAIALAASSSAADPTLLCTAAHRTGRTSPDGADLGAIYFQVHARSVGV